MRRLVLSATIAGLALAVPQQGAHASVWGPINMCGGSTLTACLDFELTKDAETDKYYFTVTNRSTNLDGVITAVGLFDRSGTGAFSPVNIDEIETSDSGLTWTPNTNNDKCHLSGGGGGNLGWLFAGCASADSSPIANGIQEDGWVRFSFTLKHDDPYFVNAFESAFAAGDITGRAHIQSLGLDECSMKIDSSTGAYSDGCSNGTSVPEPGTMLLLGTGLAGVLGMGAIRRRREDEVTEDEVA